MKDIDLKKYEKAWKAESFLNNKKLNTAEIDRYIRSSSKSIAVFFKKGLILDIFLKTIFFFFLVSFISFSDQISFQQIDYIILSITLAGIVWQIIVWRKVPENKQKKMNSVVEINHYINFYTKYYLSSIFVGALSGSLFFIIGFLSYLRLKYKEIPQFQFDDFIVMSAGIFLSYGISAAAQLLFSNYRIRQLQEVLREIEEDTFGEDNIKSHQSERKKIAFAFGIALVVGLILLVSLIFIF